jgi:hypothetical protein
MKFALVAMAPPAAMMDALCDRTCELAREIAHVRSARLVSRRIDGEGFIVCVQRWRAEASVPALLRPHLEDSLLEWTLTFARRLGALDCRWHAESSARRLPGHCRGTLQARPAVGGRGTRIDLCCEFPAGNEGLRTIFARLAAQHWRSLADAAVRRVAAPLAEPSPPAA